MKVAVIGPGAMGCLFAARLARSGSQTVLVDHKAGRAARLRKTGITIESPDASFIARPRVTLKTPSGQDLIIVLTKAYSTRELKFPPLTPILTLQNGLGNVETICSSVGSGRVLAGTTCEGATLVADGRVRHTGSGPTSLGSWTTCPVKEAAVALEKAGFDVSVTDSPGQMLWEKVAINAGINPLTALLDVPNGRLLEIPAARDLMRDLVSEATEVALEEGYRFEYSLVERTEEVCRQTNENISSMLQDIRAGRKSEIDAISGEIVNRGEVASLPTPRTRVVWQLVRSLEQR